MTPASSARPAITGDADALPDVPIAASGPVSTAFRARALGTLRTAARYVRDLPYGRVSDRARPVLVLEERRGTCTTKHALLAMLAAEQGVDLALTVGIYEMNEANTPGVGAVLAAHGLATIPEAHCYLTWQGQRIDVTRAVAASEPIARFLHEERITPAQIGEHKIAMHRRFLEVWRGHARPELDAEQAWRIREDCIAALSDPR